jgi:hypothetical protein
LFRALQKTLRPSTTSSLADAFSRLGWIGFWIQIAIGVIPLASVIYGLIFGRDSGPGTRGGFFLVDFLTIAGLLVLAFTTFWSYRYTRIAKRIADATLRPSESSVQKAAWIGVAASALGIAFSMLVMLIEAAQILIYFLRAPQAGVPVIQTTQTAAGAQASWVSAADVTNLIALILAASCEVVVLSFSLWLLFRTTYPSLEYPHDDTLD